MFTENFVKWETVQSTKKLVNERLSMANLKKFQLLYQGANDRDLLAQFWMVFR